MSWMNHRFDPSADPSKTREHLVEEQARVDRQRTMHAETMTISRSSLRQWWHAIDDSLTDFETGDMRDYERGIQRLDEVAQEIDHLVQSPGATGS
jgi:hypothetical protein